jgi:hypothetical protein
MSVEDLVEEAVYIIYEASKDEFNSILEYNEKSAKSTVPSIIQELHKSTIINFNDIYYIRSREQKKYYRLFNYRNTILVDRYGSCYLIDGLLAKCVGKLFDTILIPYDKEWTRQEVKFLINNTFMVNKGMSLEVYKRDSVIIGDDDIVIPLWYNARMLVDVWGSLQQYVVADNGKIRFEKERKINTYSIPKLMKFNNSKYELLSNLKANKGICIFRLYSSEIAEAVLYNDTEAVLCNDNAELNV